MSSDTLKKYLGGLESLPSELERNFKLMRELDDRARSVMKSIDSRAKNFMPKLAAEGGCTMTDEEGKERLNDIKSLFDKAKEYSDDKVQLATQTCELVDKQIRRLDKNLARLEGEIPEKASASRSKSEEAVVKTQNQSENANVQVHRMKKPASIQVVLQTVPSQAVKVAKTKGRR